MRAVQNATNPLKTITSLLMMAALFKFQFVENARGKSNHPNAVVQT
jgi:hypothetical protein